MNRTMFAALFALLAAAAPAAAAERRYTVTDFDRVQIDGPFSVKLVTGKASSARSVGSNAAIERVTIDVQGRTLRIRPNRSGWGGYPGEKAGAVTIEITTQALRGAAVTGSSRLAIDKVRAMRFDLALSGSGEIAVAALEADTLILGLLGSGRISAAGAVKQLRATVQGSGDFEASGLTAGTADINADTSGIVTLTVERAAKIISTGPGDTSIGGSPACTVQELGSGRVTCGSND